MDRGKCALKVFGLFEGFQHRHGHQLCEETGGNVESWVVSMMLDIFVKVVQWKKKSKAALTSWADMTSLSTNLPPHVCSLGEALEQIARFMGVLALLGPGTMDVDAFCWRMFDVVKERCLVVNGMRNFHEFKLFQFCSWFFGSSSGLELQFCYWSCLALVLFVFNLV